ncbi:hypothetical protein [Thalassolituus sp.]|uniref:hypothetical protein n=1 Tax=Thalassolituus sp. TaxID=2030822 RepID=UPI002606FD3E|nr:hypothetical protein [Thalassolituus sp.]
MAGEVKTEYSTDMEVLTAALGMSESEILSIVRRKVQQGKQGADLLAALQAEVKKLKDQEVTKKSRHLSLIYST